MLKVTVKNEPNGISLNLEGKLIGPWVSDLRELWKRERERQPEAKIIVRLISVTFVDDHGKALLAQMFRTGVQLEGTGCLVRAILDDITARPALPSTNRTSWHQTRSHRGGPAKRSFPGTPHKP